MSSATPFINEECAKETQTQMEMLTYEKSCAMFLNFPLPLKPRIRKRRVYSARSRFWIAGTSEALKSGGIKCLHSFKMGRLDSSRSWSRLGNFRLWKPTTPVASKRCPPYLNQSKYIKNNVFSSYARHHIFRLINRTIIIEFDRYLLNAKNTILKQWGSVIIML